MFDAPSRAFLAQRGPAGCALALDLGCGPGFTTELLRDALAPQRVVGVDASPAFVQEARRRAPTLEFVQHDVLELPFPTGPADLVYARFLVSHLSEPARALGAWAAALRPGGRLLLDEVEWIRSEGGAFRRYLALVEETLGARGQCLYVGPRLDAMAEGLGIAASRVREHPVDPRDAARMFALNLATLAPDDRELAGELERIATGGGDAITWGLRQVVIQAGRDRRRSPRGPASSGRRPSETACGWPPAAAASASR